MSVSLKKEIQEAYSWAGPRFSGKVTHIIGLLIESRGPVASLGELCYVYGKQGLKIPCQVVGFKEEKVLLMALAEMKDISPGAEVFPTQRVHQVAVSPSLCGRILDALGRPMDEKEEIDPEAYYSVAASPPPPLLRNRILEAMPTGIRAIDSLLTIGKGQRVGIFASAGVGKSTLIGMIAKNSQADINVIALIGERGREVREFIEDELGPDGLARSIVIVATSDQPAPLRVKGALVATAIAEYFRDCGKNVVLMMDSITRYGTALREMGLAAGEAPSSRGYPPSVFAELPRLLERAGNSNKGSITGFYTLLCESNEQDPLVDQVRSLLDGHIVLNKELAASRQFPPIDILESLSRVMKIIVSPSHLESAQEFCKLLQNYKQVEDLIHLGAYTKGTNPKADLAIEKLPKLLAFLSQLPKERCYYEQSIEALHELIK